jgi:hypothetical protein
MAEFRMKSPVAGFHFSALNAVAAKLLKIVYWVLKNNKGSF